MIPGSPIGSSQSIQPQGGGARACGASAATAAGARAAAETFGAARPGGGAGSSASSFDLASRSLAIATIARAPACTIPSRASTVAHRIPLHALGLDNAAARALANAPNAPNARPIVTPSNDALGIIASYLPQRDQLLMRCMNKSTHKVVNAAIHTLKLTTREACVALREPHAFRNLRELHLTGTHLPSPTIDALRWHPALDTLHIEMLTGHDVTTLAASAHIRSLSVKYIYQDEITALRALADNNVLTSLSLAVTQASSLAALSRNMTLQKLSIALSDLPPLLLRSLAGMAALEELRLISQGSQHLRIDVDDMLAISAKPLKSLTFHRFQMDNATRLRLATSQTAGLEMELCTSFESADFAALSRNQSITSLFIKPDNDLRIRYDDVLSLVTNGSPRLESLNIRFRSDTPDIARAGIQSAWIASGKQVSKLHLDVWTMRQSEEG